MALLFMFSSITVVTVNGIKEVNAGQGACDQRMGEVMSAANSLGILLRMGQSFPAQYFHFKITL